METKNKKADKNPAKKEVEYKTEITEAERQKIADLLKQGLSVNKIREELKIRRRAIRPIRNELKSRGEL